MFTIKGDISSLTPSQAESLASFVLSFASGAQNDEAGENYNTDHVIVTYEDDGSATKDKDNPVTLTRLDAFWEKLMSNPSAISPEESEEMRLFLGVPNIEDDNEAVFGPIVHLPAGQREAIEKWNASIDS